MKKDIVLNPVIWSPSDERIKSSQMYQFIQNINLSSRYHSFLLTSAKLNGFRGETFTSIIRPYNLFRNRKLDPNKLNSIRILTFKLRLSTKSCEVF